MPRPVGGASLRRMTTYEFWRHVADRGVWAIKLVDGDVVGACGPLEPTSVNCSWLDTYTYSADDAAGIQAHRDRFRLIGDEELLLLSAVSD